MAERSVKHVCTTVLACPFYRTLTGSTGIIIQLVASIAGLIINITLALGILHHAASLILMWLVSYENTFLQNIRKNSNKRNFKMITLLKRCDLLYFKLFSGRIPIRHLWLHDSFCNCIECSFGQKRRQ